MSRNQYSPPDSFSVTPLLTLLPRGGDIRHLNSLVSSLYARYENVSMAQKELGENEPPEVRKRLNAEQLMLKQVLDWVAAQPELKGKG